MPSTQYELSGALACCSLLYSMVSLRLFHAHTRTHVHAQPSAHHPGTSSLSRTEKCRGPTNLLYRLGPSCKATRPGDNWTWGTSLSLPPALGSLQFTSPTVHPLRAWHSAGDMAMTHMSLLFPGAQRTAAAQARQGVRRGGRVVTCEGEDPVARPPEEAGGPELGK